MSTYTPIATQTLNSNAASVTFTNIPQNFTDLIVVATGQVVSESTLYFRFNNDSGSNYSTTVLYGTGSAAGGYRWSNQAQMYFYNWNGNNQGNAIFNIQNYSNTTTNKTVIARTNNATNTATACAGLWRSTAAITELLIHSNDTFVSGSTFNLYGIAAGAPKAFGGNTVTTDGTYWYHTFTSSGVFTPTQSLTADYLVVAGGGGGGRSNSQSFAGGSGGGAGGYRTSIGGTALSLTAQTYAVVIGAGGATQTTANTAGNNGSNSVFSTITSTGGGGGGAAGAGQPNGRNGGSGGGGAYNTGSGTNGTAGSGNAGSYSPSEGNNGGVTTGNLNGSGGGGAGAVGGNSGTNGGDGGAGSSNSISGSSVTYAGGGGGGAYLNSAGAGGSGGGGAGGPRGNSGTAGTVNTGGGGGGSGTDTALGNGGAGGSGIVIVRYAV